MANSGPRYIPSDNLKCLNDNSELLGGSLLTLLTLSAHSVKALIPTNVSVGPTVQWYIPLTPFETIFLHLAILQLILLRYLQMLPVNLNDFVNGMNFFGRKKRSVIQKMCTLDDVSMSLLKVLKVLDKDDCGVRTICELEASYNLRTGVIPDEAVLILSALKVSRKRKRALESGLNCGPEPNSDPKTWPISPFEDAEFHGSESVFKNSTLCEIRYRACPLNKQDILLYVNQVFMNLD